MLRQEAGIQVDKFYPPTDWLDNNNKQIDIRKNAENNSIVLLVGHSADFTKYSLLGFLAQVSSGTYDVYIDDVLVGSGITSYTQYDIDFSTINTSYGSATTPEALVLHKVVIKPNTSGAMITAFRCIRTTGITSDQRQGVMWIHCELSNEIDLNSFIGNQSYNVRNIICIAITSKGDFLLNKYAYIFCALANNLKYIPLVDKGIMFSCLYGVSNNKRVRFVNFSNKENFNFTNDYALEQITYRKFTKNNNTVFNSCYAETRSLKIISHFPSDTITGLTDYLTNATKLYPTKLDTSAFTGLTKIGTYGSSTYPMRGLRGLKVSNEAPFTGASPQIDVKYTGLDRDALVKLFQSLPTVTGGQTLNCVSCSGNNLTKVGSPTIVDGVVSGFSSSDYLRLPQINSNSYNRIEIETKIKTEQTITNSLIIGTTSYYIMGLAIIDNKFVARCHYGSYISCYSDVIPQINTEYKLKCVIDLNTKKLSITVNQIENTKDIVGSSLSNIIYSVGASNNIGVFNGSIYLEDTSIKIDRNYLMKGYITDTDKAIATDKGWGLVLS